MKRILKCFFACVMSALLTGCCVLDVNMSFNDKGEYKPSIKMLYDVAFFEGSDLVNLDDMIAESKKSFEESAKEKVTVKDIEEVRDNKKYKGFTASTDEYVNPKETDSVKSEISKDNILKVSVSTDDVFGGENTNIGMYSASGASMTYTITMPSKVIESNFGKVEGNKVVVDLLKDEVKGDIVITCDITKSNNTLVYLGVACVLGAGVIYYVLRKRNKSNISSELGDSNNSVVSEEVSSLTSGDVDDKESTVNPDTENSLVEDEKVVTDSDEGIDTGENESKIEDATIVEEDTSSNEESTVEDNTSNEDSTELENTENNESLKEDKNSTTE